MASADNRCRLLAAAAAAAQRPVGAAESDISRRDESLQVAHLARQLKQTKLEEEPEEEAGRMLLAPADEHQRPGASGKMDFGPFGQEEPEEPLLLMQMQQQQQHHHHYYHHHGQHQHQHPFEASYHSAFNESQGSYYGALAPGSTGAGDFLGQLEPMAAGGGGVGQEEQEESAHYANLDASCYHYEQQELPDSVVQLNYQHQQHQQQHQQQPSNSAGACWQEQNLGPKTPHDKHQEPELKVCEWEACGNTFLDMAEFVKHLEEAHVNQLPREKNRYYCLWAQCKRNEQEFNARYKLLIHMRVHSGEKPYPCPSANCKKSFSRLENLKIHQRSHTGEKPYKCNFRACPKSFTNSSDRIKHHKTHKDPKPYACSHQGCSKRYTDPSSLRKHLRAHRRQQVPPSAAAELARLEPTAALQQPPAQFAAAAGHHAHAQFSRSWCAGSTPSSLGAGPPRPAEQAGFYQPAPGPLCAGSQPLYPAQVGHQQQHQQQHQQHQHQQPYNNHNLNLKLSQRHEALMQSLPPIGGFRAPQTHQQQQQQYHDAWPGGGGQL